MFPRRVLLNAMPYIHLRNFQSQHCDGQGHPLTIDGKVGILTWSSLFDKEIPQAKSESPVIKKVIEIAHNEIGVSEVPVGSNKGPRVEEYLRNVRLGPGFPWCAAFVFWCYSEACIKLHIPNPLVKVPGCMQHWKKTTGTRITTKQAINDPTLLEPGMIFIISRGDGKGHTGIVTGIQDGFILTIEGNTNNTHSSEGVKVCALRRKISTINPGFIKYDCSFV